MKFHRRDLHVVSIRAFGAQSLFIKEYHSSIDHYTKVAVTFHALNW